MIDNALWGYVQPKGGWSEFARRIRRAEELAATQPQNQEGDLTRTPSSLTKFAADNRALAELDLLQELIDSPEGDMLMCGNLASPIPEIEERHTRVLKYYGRFILNLAVYGAVLYQLKDSDFDGSTDLSAAQAAFAELKSRVAMAPILRHFDSAKEVHIMLFANDWALCSTLMQMHDDKLHPVQFCGRVLKENEVNYHPAEKEVLAFLQLLKICHTHVHSVLNAGMDLPAYAVLSPSCQLCLRERDVNFVQFLQASITPHVGLDESLEHISPPSKNSATVRMDPELLYAKIPRDYKGHVLSFDGSAKTEKNGGYGSCSWILWRLPEWDIEIAASAYLSSTTVNLAEYTGMNNGVKAAIDRGVTDLVIVGDSRLAIQQSMGVIACKKETLQVELARHKELTKNLNSVKYLHVIRLYNSAADSMATEALDTQISRVVLNAERKAELKTLNRIPEIMYAAGDSTDEGEEGPKACRITRSQVRQVRFEDDERKKTNTPLPANEEDPTRPEATQIDLNSELEIRRRQPARRIETSSEAEFGDTQP
ncbi:Hypothetical protein PHPALM_18668, partial [Phytophthora palmivora]